MEGKTGIQDGRTETKMMTGEAEADGQIREETGAMKKWRLTKESKDEMREIVGKEEIMMIGSMKVIEGMIVIDKGVVMIEEENMKRIEDAIMIEGLIVTVERGMTLKEIENRDHLGEEMMVKKEELKDDLVTEEEIKDKIGDEMRMTEKDKIGKVEDLAVHKKTGM